MHVLDVSNGDGQRLPFSTLAVASTTSPKEATSFGVNLRVTGHCSQGGRKYMEDFFSVAYHESESSKDLEYTFVGIYDGHGGNEAATFAKEHLMVEIINQKLFWSNSDEDVLRAIRNGYISTHYAMWKEQEKWPKTSSGLPSTAGTTATIAFIRHEKMFIGHVGDSGIVLGYQNSNENFWRARQLTVDHKPESALEKKRILKSGGKIAYKSGVPRVVWNRPRNGHKGPVRRSTAVDEIPFLAVARSLGDLWSYNSTLNEFIVSPVPDVKVIKIDSNTFRCLIFGTDGLWNVVTPQEAVETVREKEIVNQSLNKHWGDNNAWSNPSKVLVDEALKSWSSKKMRADNTSVVTIIFNPCRANTKKSESVDGLTILNDIVCLQKHTDVNLEDKCSNNLAKKYSSNLNFKVSSNHYNTYFFDEGHHQLCHYETICPSNTASDSFLLPCTDSSDCYSDRHDYTKNYQINYDPLIYNQNNVYSLAESYNSLLTATLNQDNCNTKSGNSSPCTKSKDITKIDPDEYHSFNKFNYTWLAGNDRVQHYHCNAKNQAEQQLYQEQCMYGKDGYSLTKLETRIERQLRGSDVMHKDKLNQKPEISTMFENGYSVIESINSKCDYEANAKSFERRSDNISFIDEFPMKKNASCYSKSDNMALEKSNYNSYNCESKYLENTLENKWRSPNESININGNSSFEEFSSTPDLKSCAESKAQTRSDATAKNNVDSRQLISQPSAPKMPAFRNVPNENNRRQRRQLVQQNSKMYEKRMLRSMTVDFGKRTLRSRNTFSKDLKTKISTTTNLRRSAIVHNKKQIQTAENSSSLIIKKDAAFKTRDITRSCSVWAESNAVTKQSYSNQNHKQKTRICAYCYNTDSDKKMILKKNGNHCKLPTTCNRKSSSNISTIPTASQPIKQVSISFAKKINFKKQRIGNRKENNVNQN